MGKPVKVPKRLVPTAEAARILGVDPNGLRKRASLGLLTVYTAGDDLRVRLYDQDQLEALLVPRPIARREEVAATA